MPKTTVTDNGIEKISDNKSQKSAKKKVQTPSFLKEIDYWLDGIDDSMYKRKQRRLERKKQEEKNYNKKNIKWRAIFVFIIAALIFIISVIIKIVSLYVISNKEILMYIDIVSGLAESVSGIVLGLSIGNMSLDFFSYADYMREIVESVVIKKEFLKTTSSKEKERIVEELEASLYFEGKELKSDSLYYNIKNKIVPLKEYYEKSFTHIDCSIKDGKIYKTLYTTLFINLKEEVTRYELPFTIYFNKNDTNTKEKTYNIDEVQVNGESIKILEEYLVCDDSEEMKGQEKYSFIFPFTLKKGTNVIYYVSHSVVDVNDNTYTRTIAVPCKNCVVEMYLNNADYRIAGQGFAIDKEKILDIQYYNNACRIEFKDWIIPGDGCIFVINKR